MTQLTEVFNNIATAINHKGVSGQMTPEEMPSKISQIGDGPGSRYGVTMDTIFNVDANGKLIKPTSPSYLEFNGIKSASATSIWTSKFRYCDGVETVKFPDLISVDAPNGFSYTFSSDTSNIKSADFPQLKIASGNFTFDNCFANCPELTAISFYNLKRVGYYSMRSICQNCYSLISADFSSLSGTNSRSFVSSFANSGLHDITFPSMTLAYSESFIDAFNSCDDLSAVNFPALTTIHAKQTFKNAFKDCATLKSLQFQNVTALTGDSTSTTNATFGGNNTITDIYFPNVKHVYNNYLFDSACTSLTGVHFSTDSTEISTEVGYQTMWGAPATCNILFDL